MQYKIVYRPLTPISNQWALQENEHVNGAEESHELIVDAVDENHALQIFANMVHHTKIKIAQYRIELLYQDYDQY